MATPFPITMPPGTLLGRLPLPQSGEADAIPFLALFAPATNSLTADVSLTNIATFFDGPSIAQGTSGTWFASGTVTIEDTASSADFVVKLWDGTSVIASALHRSVNAGGRIAVSLSGFITSPLGNIRISVKDLTATTGLIRFNVTGASKDSTITAIRIG